jgi:hypothetical protein
VTGEIFSVLLIQRVSIFILKIQSYVVLQFTGCGVSLLSALFLQ